MRPFRDITIRRKLILIIMLTCTVVLLLSGGMYVVFEWVNLRKSIVEDLSAKAEIIGYNCKAALAFEDAKDAEGVLKALSTETSILFGCIYTPDGEIFASYHQQGRKTKALPAGRRTDGYIFGHGRITLFKQISLDGETIGTVCLQSDLSNMYTMLMHSTAAIIIFISIAFLIACFMSSVLQGLISKPVLSLTRAVEAVSKKKDYSIRAPKQTNDEIGFLIDAFNQMLEQIQNHQASLLSVNKQLIKEIAERKKAEQTLEELNEELEGAVEKLTGANLELREFAYVTAHDLKAPLRAICILADWLSTDYGDKFDEEGKKQVTMLVSRTKRMSRHVDSILQLSEIGHVPGEEGKVDLNMLVREVIDSIAPPENIQITIENKLPVIVCSKVRVTQVFQNLLSNAVKYMNKPDGRIKIGCVDESSFWKFSVSDNGPGIEEQYFEKIFQIFQTLAPRDKAEGTGIGLSLVKKIVKKYGGTIWVQSETGQGSTFFFTLPKQQAHLADKVQTQAAIIS